MSKFTEEIHQPTTLVEAMEKLNKNYATCKIGRDTFILDETRDPVEFMIVKGFTTHFANNYLVIDIPAEVEGKPSKTKEIKVADAWLKWDKRRSYNGVEFSPSGKLPKGYYNLWRGLPYKSVEHHGLTDKFWEFVLDIICNGDADLFIYVKKYMAHAVQKPGELPKVALILRGLKGTGKGMFANIFGSLFGKAYGAYSNPEHIMGRFSGHLKDKVIVFADEVFWGGNKKEEGVLKALITEPTRAVEMKGKDTFEVNNYVRLIMAANEDWAAPSSLDERRYVFCNVSADKKGYHSYWNEIGTMLTSDDCKKALMFELMAVDVAKFEPMRDIPTSNAELGIDMAEESMESVMAFVYSILTTGLPNGKMSASGLFVDYKEYCKEAHIRFPKNNIVFGRKVSKLLPITRKRDMDGVVYMAPSLQVCRQHFELAVGYKGKGLWEHSPMSGEEAGGERVRKLMSI